MSNGNDNQVLALARILFDMRYEDINAIGRLLHDMTHTGEQPEVWDLNDERDWAELLFRWAESVVEENAEDDVSKA